MSLREVATVLTADIPISSFDGELTGVSTDTRTIKPGNLFLALTGENFDGHEYVDAAFEKGASAAIVLKSKLGELNGRGQILIGVPDTLRAFGLIAREWRRKFSIPIVGVTGSVGKTTTKEMLALTLSSLSPVLKTDKNENNEVGVPQLLLRLTEDHNAAVVEMGMRGLGQIAYLANIAEPTVGVVTRIGENHIELLGSLEKIAQAKGELIESLPANGLAVLNADDTFFGSLSARARCRIATFGLDHPKATVRATDLKLTSPGWVGQARYGDQVSELVVPSPSRHDVSNALAAVATAVELGVDFATAVDSIRHFKPVSMRMEVVTTRSGVTILSDCYNASPVSMRSALDTLSKYGERLRKIAFLGDMKELGGYAQPMHAEISSYAEQLGLSELYAVGPVFGEQLQLSRAKFADSIEASGFAKALQLADNAVVLVKGSRAMAMERIVEALIA